MTFLPILASSASRMVSPSHSPSPQVSPLGKFRPVILGDTAELVAGAILKGIGGFLASQAERGQYRYVRCTTPDFLVMASAKSFVKYFVMKDLRLNPSIPVTTSDESMHVRTAVAPYPRPNIA
jgi:hypothetical protein